MGPDVKNVLYSAARNNGLSWSLRQKVPGMNRKWKAAMWSPTQQVDEATEGEGGSSQLAELKAVQLALDIAEREGWPRLYLYTDSWMVANALWGWLKRWKEGNWQCGGKPILAAEEWKDIATRVGRLPVKVRHVDAHIPKSRANEEHRNNEQCRKPFPWTEIKANVPLGSGPGSQIPLSRSLTLQGSQRNVLDSNISPSCLNQKHLFGNPVHGLPYASKQTRQDHEKDYKPY
ncbi:hypothetical protein DUI87_02867 [Hirundo rustica rustica]|uniref:RNase H type-1 domain-containing protein n=1 Tax=Hirundo rustica rustica TaxID=333673 RepID=A0A3M0LAF2_HIRRU|nr:hypothetical protein DUI87_02867 [Hirundo rustica rustica]